jgi:hypothetical protein
MAKKQTYWYLVSKEKPSFKTKNELEKELGFKLESTKPRYKKGDWYYTLKISGIRSKVMEFGALLLRSKNFKPIIKPKIKPTLTNPKTKI